MSGTTKRLSAVISGRHCRINCAHKEGHTVIAPYAYEVAQRLSRRRARAHRWRHTPAAHTGTQIYSTTQTTYHAHTTYHAQTTYHAARTTTHRRAL